MTTLVLAALLLQDGPVAIGDIVPDTTVTDTAGNAISLASFRATSAREGRPVILIAWSNRCPTGRQFQEKYAEIARWCADHNVGFATFCSYGDTSEEVGRLNLSYPVAIEGARDLDRVLGAERVTHSFVLDADGRLVYRGAIDNSQRRRDPEYVCYPLAAAQAVLDGGEVDPAETRAFG